MNVPLESDPPKTTTAVAESSSQRDRQLKYQQRPSTNSGSNESPEASKKSPTPLETPEERRRRIEQVLFGSSRSPSNHSLKSQSNSLMSLNDLDLSTHSNSPRSTLNRGKYEKTSSKGKLKRNHSLSPLRFCVQERLKSNVNSSKQPSKQIKTNAGKLSASKSESNLDSNEMCWSSLDEDSLASENVCFDKEADDDDDETENKPPIINVADDDDDGECHLLAPSKVSKSQDLFTQVFFPADKQGKRLLTKEELAKTRNNVYGGKKAPMIHSHSDATPTMAKERSPVPSKSVQSARTSCSESPENTLQVQDYLAHLRNNSASPEARSRERELNSLNNTKKFRCFKDFWETKTKTLLEEKKMYDDWKQSSR